MDAQEAKRILNGTVVDLRSVSAYEALSKIAEACGLEAISAGVAGLVVEMITEEVPSLPYPFLWCGSSLQLLSDCGLNPFAMKLLVEAYLTNRDGATVVFELDGVLVTLSPARASGDCTCTQHLSTGESGSICNQHGGE